MQKRIKIRAVSSREYTYNYVREWARREADGNRAEEKHAIFSLFSLLEEGIRGKRVLEIGSGGGSFLKQLENAGANVIGIDLFSPPVPPNRIKGDFMTHDFGGTFDFIFALGVFERCALYSPALLDNSSEREEKLREFPPDKMLRRLIELLNKNGYCIFRTYVESLVFTEEMARKLGFSLSHYRRQLSTDKYGTPGNLPFGIEFREENYYILAQD